MVILTIVQERMVLKKNLLATAAITLDMVWGFRHMVALIFKVFSGGSVNSPANDGYLGYYGRYPSFAGDLRAPPKLWLLFSFRFLSFSFLLYIYMYIILLKATHFKAPAGQTLVRGSGRHFLVITILFWSLFWGDPLDRGASFSIQNLSENQ